jgi:hypothetical protein
MWNSFAATMLVEAVMFVSGVWLYANMTRAKDSIGRYALWSFVAFLAIIYLANAFGTPPPSSTAVAAVTLFVWLFPLWASWADAHRELT